MTIGFPIIAIYVVPVFMRIFESWHSTAAVLYSDATHRIRKHTMKRSAETRGMTVPVLSDFKIFEA